MAGIILLEAVDSLQPNLATQARSDRSVSLVDLGKKLLEAARLGDTEEVRTLMTNGAPFTTDWLGTSPLHMAAQYGHLSTAEVLIRAGISRDARTKVDRTPLHVAAQEGHVDIVELLIKNGTDVEAKDMLKMTPLHWAVERGHTAVIELLLENGADINSLSKFDKTPATVAFDNGRLDIVQLLTCGEIAKRLSIEESEESVRVIAADKTSESELTAEEDEMILRMEEQHAKGNSVRPISLHPNMASRKKSTKVADGGLEERTEQGNTSVLATLAALAETMGPLTAGNSGSAADTLRWLEQHGITMLPGDNSTIIASALESGQTISLTEAGKLALGWTKKQNSTKFPKNTGTTLEQRIENVVGDISSQKLFTIVTDQSQIPSLVSGGTTGPIVVTMSNSGLESPDQVVSLTLNSSDENELETPVVKRPRKAAEDDVSKMDRDQLTRLLEEAQRKAKEYEAQLKVKQHEADEYKKKLESISSPSVKK